MRMPLRAHSLCALSHILDMPWLSLTHFCVVSLRLRVAYQAEKAFEEHLQRFATRSEIALEAKRCPLFTGIARERDVRAQND